MNGKLPSDRFQPAGYDHHGFRVAAQQWRNQLAKVLDDDLDLLRDVVWVESDPTHDPLHRRAAFDLFLIEFLAVVRKLESQLVGRVILQDVENEPFLDRLTHRIHMKGSWQIALAG